MDLSIYNSNLFSNHKWYSAQWIALCIKITEVTLCALLHTVS